MLCELICATMVQSLHPCCAVCAGCMSTLVCGGCSTRFGIRPTLIMLSAPMCSGLQLGAQWRISFCQCVRDTMPEERGCVRIMFCFQTSIPQICFQGGLGLWEWVMIDKAYTPA